MAIQRFSLAAVQQIRQYIQNALAVDAAKQVQPWVGLEETDDLPEPTSLDELSSVFAFGGLSATEIALPQAHWSLSTVNPASALLKLPGVALKPDWRLVSYLYQDSDSSAGLVLALPELLATTAQLEKARAESSAKQPPQPEGALADFMEAIQGDRSIASFMVASLLCRELREFGARGRYQSWTHHRLVEALPTQVKWQWQSEPPKDLSPKVKLMPDGQAIVEFFSCRVISEIALYRHLDQYPVAQYKLKRLDKPLAKAQR